MEFLSSTISTNPQISPAIQFLTWKSPSRLTIPKSGNPRSHPQFSRYLFRSIPSRNFQISAHSRRPTNRQNYLRKKLSQQHHQQVRDLQTSNFDKVDSNVDISDEMNSNLDKIRVDNDSNFDSSSGDMKKNLEGSSIDNDCSDGVEESEMDLRKRKFGESVMWNKLESWVDQYKKDSEFWGIGSGPIFTVFQDSEGKVERVVVNEDEILRRTRVDPQSSNESEDLSEFNFKTSFAKDLAREMESGSNVIPKNSSVAKFLPSGGETESRLTKAIRGVTIKPGLLPRMSKVGVLVLCGLVMVWSFRGLFNIGKDSKEEYTSLEKEMLRRKIKARKEKEKVVKGSVEVVQDPVEPKIMPFKRPQLDKEELVSTIFKAKGSKSELETVEYSGEQTKEFKEKIEEIRAMARLARESEKRDVLSDDSDGDYSDGEDSQALKELSTHSESPQNDFLFQKEISSSDSDETNDDIGQSENEALHEKSETSFHDIPDSTENWRPEVNTKLVSKSSDLSEANLHSEGPGSQSGPYENSSRKKLRIIKSAKEAREYLSSKHDKLEVNQKHEVRNNELTDFAVTMPSTNGASGTTNQILDSTNETYESSSISGIHDLSDPSENYRGTTEGNADLDKDAGISELKIREIKETDISASQENFNYKNEISSSVRGKPESISTEFDEGLIQKEEVSTPLKKHNSEVTEKEEVLIGLQVPESTSVDEVKDRTADLGASVKKENWIEKNFHEFEPIMEKMGVGFRNNYLVAREKADQETELMIASDGAESELDWMKDEKLREIVFKVRDNELSGRDPFHLMDEEDKCAFFSGLEKKVDQENQKLQNLHEYLHSNIENLDYGADGISLFDAPEKVMPRWKVPPAEKNPEFLNNFMEQRKANVAEGLKKSFTSNKTGKDSVHESKDSSSNGNIPAATDATTSKELHKDNLASSKTVIQGSDGSLRAGKKSGREYWQHTKKWSQGFVESYNAETDPEVKSVMKDMGKDLDRWITEKEIQEAADLMNRVPEKGQKFIKQKLEKVKREMELYGPQAVVSKYSEYTDEKEEDYLWWLDLPFVLCIELYTVENGEQKVGFYSLEMASDLELDPKQYHVVAFEDASECKNFCYIVQAHMEMLGIGNAFVVARPPKDAFREAKANGFSVTVIRKGQVKLNIDQTLEEVEESIEEIGSKIYHDKITKGRSVNIDALMKGVFGVSKSTKRKRRKSKKKRITP
ncbi:hypothetical protein ABFS82_02G175400 [Erythranthe guttata]